MTDQEKIDEIMDNFDFARVEQCMRAMKWRWGIGDESHYPNQPELWIHYPNQSELRKVAHGLLKNALAEDVIGIAGGGFRVTKQDGELMLSFNVAEWYVCDGDEQEATS